MIEPLAAEGDGEDAAASEEDAPAPGEDAAASGEAVMPEDQATGLEAAGVDADPDEPGKRLAEVVHLPTAGRTAETVREELHGE